jgi:hypothetical protein
LENKEVETIEVQVNETEKKENNKSETKATLRDNIYSRIDISVASLDKFIAVLFIAIIASLIIGIFS